MRVKGEWRLYMIQEAPSEEVQLGEVPYFSQAYPKLCELFRLTQPFSLHGHLSLV